MFKRKCGKNKNKGFTLIELLVVIIIIGLLAGVLLTTVRGAINRGRDARIIAAMGQIRTQAEIFYTNKTSPTFSGIRTEPAITQIENDIIANQGAVTSTNRGLKWGEVGDNHYIVWVFLNTVDRDNKNIYCIDAGGLSCKRRGEPPGSSCQCGES